MSVVLLNAAVDHIRAQFTRAEVAEVRPYGGEFSGAELTNTSYNCPAVLVTVLGWKPEPQSKRLSGRDIRGVRMAAFVLTKHARRELRMAQAMTLAERLCLVLKAWNPLLLDLPMALGSLEAEPVAENLYGRAIDTAGQAMWLVGWEQCVKPTVPLPQLYDLLAIEIEDTTRQGTAPASSPAPASAPVVTEDVAFAPLPPA